MVVHEGLLDWVAVVLVRMVVVLNRRIADTLKRFLQVRLLGRHVPFIKRADRQIRKFLLLPEIGCRVLLPADTFNPSVTVESFGNF